PPQDPEPARRRVRGDPAGGRGAPLAEGGALATGGGRLRLETGCRDGCGSASGRAVGPAGGRRPRRPAVLPDARPVCADRRGRRGPQPDPEPRRVTAPLGRYLAG